MANENFLQTLDEFSGVTNKIIVKLNEKFDWIHEHHQRCKVAKTVGTTASVGGAAVIGGALLAAPFTGGLSIVAATGAGAIASIGGAGMNLATDIADMITQRIEESQIKAICDERNGVANRLMEYFAELEDVAAQLETLKIDKEIAYFLSLVNIASKANATKTTAEDIMKLSKCVQLGKGTYGVLIRNGGYFWKGMRLQSEALMKGLAYFGFNVSKTGAMAVVRTGTVIFNGVFAIYDVYSLVQTLKNNHPTADVIAELIKQLEEELAEIVALREVVRDINAAEFFNE